MTAIGLISFHIGFPRHLHPFRDDCHDDGHALILRFTSAFAALAHGEAASGRAHTFYAGRRARYIMPRHDTDILFFMLDAFSARRHAARRRRTAGF